MLPKTTTKRDNNLREFEIWLTGNWQTRALFTRQKKILARSPALADHAQNLSGPAPDNILGVPKFHPNPHTSSGVIAGRADVVEMRHKVFPCIIHTVCREVVRNNCQARNLNREDAMDRSSWKKLIKIR